MPHETELEPEVSPLLAKLRELRKRQDLKLVPCAMLVDKVTLPDGRVLDFKLRPYQTQMVLHLLLMSRFLIGDDTGLGKTVETIAALGYKWEASPDLKVVIVTTKSAVTQWRDEIHQFMRGVTTFRTIGSPEQRKKVREAFLAAKGPAALLCGYRTLVQDFTAIQDWKDMALIFDEATAFKNPQTRIHQVVEHLSKSAPIVWALTATLIRNNLTEGYGISRVVVPELFPRALSAFVAGYCLTVSVPVKRGRRVEKIVGHSSTHVKKFRDAIEPFYLGRAKADVAPDLPILTPRELAVPLTTQEWSAYKNLVLGVLLEQKTESNLLTTEQKKISKMEALLRCQQLVNHVGLIVGKEAAGAIESSKLEALIDLLTEGDLADQRVIVYSRFRGFLVDYVEPRLIEAGVSVVRVTGSEDEEQRREAQVSFRAGRARVILLTSAGSEALNLQEAQAMVLMDTPWSAGEYLQLVGRMVRIGSPNDRCLAIHLAAQAPDLATTRRGKRPETIDEYTIQVMGRKLKLVEEVLGQRLRAAPGKEVPPAPDLSASEMTEILDAMVGGLQELRSNP